PPVRCEPEGEGPCPEFCVRGYRTRGSCRRTTGRRAGRTGAVRRPDRRKVTKKDRADERAEPARSGHCSRTAGEAPGSRRQEGVRMPRRHRGRKSELRQGCSEVSAGSGGADLDRRPKAHAPGAEREDRGDAGAETPEGGPVERVKQLVVFQALDPAPLVATGDGGAQLASRLGVSGPVVPVLGQDPLATKDADAGV